MRRLLLVSVLEPEAIGARLAQARNEAGLTQEQAADLVGVGTRSLQGYEAGDVVPYRHMQKFAEAYKKSLEWLLHGDEIASMSDEEAVRHAVREELRPILAALARVEALLQDDETPPPEPPVPV